LAAFKKKEKTDAWAAQARKEVAPQPRGHLTTRRQMPIGRGMCPHQISCSNSSACTPFLLLTYRSTIAELRSRSWREGGSAQRSLALVSARCKGRRLRCRVFCNLYCRCTYSTLRDSSIAAQEVRPCPDLCTHFASAQLQRKRSSD
jgi:hypothetical protein